MSNHASGTPGWLVIVRRTFAVLAGAVFVYAGVLKLLDPLRFASDISNYQILPWSVAVRLAFYLPWLEVLCGLALIFQRLFTGALFLTSGLMLIFIGATVSAKARGIDVACGCFGSASGNLSFSWHLVLDVCLLGVLVLLWFWPSLSPSAPSTER
ncbi:MAG: MauE/DoxX family redox-associated membrane protein [Chthoniobacterales bacterium]